LGCLVPQVPQAAAGASGGRERRNVRGPLWRAPGQAEERRHAERRKGPEYDAVRNDELQDQLPTSLLDTARTAVIRACRWGGVLRPGWLQSSPGPLSLV
jgi:hypothetical protein